VAKGIGSNISAIVIVVLLVFGVAVTVFSIQRSTDTRSRAAGSGAPSGAHYSLNVVGVPKNKTADMTGSSGHRIFVPLNGKCNIKLESGDFAVLDGNCTDGSGQFQLPNPDTDNDGFTSYTVWARTLGKPGGRSETMTCGVDPIDLQTYCSVYTLVQTREKGKSTFTNVSKDLLYVSYDVDGDGSLDRIPLFDDRLENYYWSYDNNGLKVMQLRFYEVSTETQTP
jgi:hypothetical protein